eukprot:4964975-Amphidinium_carterae.1
MSSADFSSHQETLRRSRSSCSRGLEGVSSRADHAEYIIRIRSGAPASGVHSIPDAPVVTFRAQSWTVSSPVTSAVRASHDDESWHACWCKCQEDVRKCTSLHGVDMTRAIVLLQVPAMTKTEIHREVNLEQALSASVGLLFAQWSSWQ